MTYLSVGPGGSAYLNKRPYPEARCVLYVGALESNSGRRRSNETDWNTKLTSLGLQANFDLQEENLSSSALTNLSSSNLFVLGYVQNMTPIGMSVLGEWGVRHLHRPEVKRQIHLGPKLLAAPEPGRAVMRTSEGYGQRDL